MLKVKNKKAKTVTTAKRSTSTAPKRKNRITEAVHETAKDFHAAGLINHTTMREFDALCLPKVPSYTARRIKALRAKCKCSQTVFAMYLNVSASSLRQWELGAKKPAGVACKLLNIIEMKGLEALV